MREPVRNDDDGPRGCGVSRHLALVPAAGGHGHRKAWPDCPATRAQPLWWLSRRLGAGSNAVWNPAEMPDPSRFRECNGVFPTPVNGWKDGKAVGAAICYGLSPGLYDGKPDADGGLLHSTYISAGFSLASLTTDLRKARTTLSAQNNWLGAAFASGPNERIHLLGNGSIADKAWTVDTYAFSAVQYRSAFIAARPPDNGTNFGGNCQFNNSHSFSKSCGTHGSQIYVVHSLWGRVVERVVGSSVWLCVDSTGSDPRIVGAPGAFLCIAIVRGGYTVANTTQLPLAPGGMDTTGVLVCLGDKSSPIVFQGADAADFDSFDDFVERVLSLRLEHDRNTGHTAFVTLDHTVLEYIADSVQIPSINESAVDLTPSTMPLYSAPPYLETAYGDAVFTITYPGRSDLTAKLDFSGPWR